MARPGVHGIKNTKGRIEGNKMNILIIGNGFDIAHDLSTKYKDFLE